MFAEEVINPVEDIDAIVVAPYLNINFPPLSSIVKFVVKSLGVDAAVPVVFWFRVGNVQLAKSPEAGVPRTGVVKVGDVSVLFVSVSVVLRPTNVVVASGNVTTRPAEDTASIKVIALAAELTLLKRIPLSKSAPSLIVTRPVPLG